MTPSEFGRLQEGHEAMKLDIAEMRVELSANTAITSEIREVLTAARTGFKVIGWLGSFVKWGAAIAAPVLAAMAAWHGYHK